MLRVNNFQGHALNLSDVMRIAPHIEAKYERTRIQAGDVLLTIVGSVGQVALVPEALNGWNIARAVAMIRPIEPELSRWISLVLRAPQAQYQLGIAANTTVQTTINLKDLRELRIQLPDKKVRGAITHILGTLDDKIELNHRRNETLEAMARALFQDWFVDFGPVRAKMDGREPYLPAHLWQFFPDRLNGKGRPEGWEVTSLGEATVELRRGISPSYVESGGIRVLNQKCIRNREVNFAPARRHDHSQRMIDGREVLAGDILVNSTGVGTLGRVAQIWNVDEPTVVDSHVTLVRANTDVVSTYYLGLNMTGREVEIEALGEGSTGQTELSRARLGSVKILVPTREVLNQFDIQVRPLLGEMISNTEESVVLAQLRDTLLPKLISGEIGIKDAEHFMERASA
jgi:type I restriction enzyme S subunit